MAVAKIDDWESTVTNSANTLTLSGITAGANRLIVCFVTSEAAAPGASAINIGGESGEQISGSPVVAGANGTGQTISSWIIKEAAIDARANLTITITFTAQPTTVSIQAAVFSGVDQTTPIVEYQEDFTDVATPNPITTVDIDVSSTDNYVVACAGMGNDLGSAAWHADLTEQTELSINATAGASVADASPGSTGNLAVECTWVTPNRSAIASIEIGAEADTYEMVGVTKDSGGSTLASVEVYLIKDNGDNTCTWIGYDLSDGSGNYVIGGITDNDASYLVVGWKDDTPHVFDVGDHVLQPTLE